MNWWVCNGPVPKGCSCYTSKPAYAHLYIYTPCHTLKYIFLNVLQLIPLKNKQFL